MQCYGEFSLSFEPIQLAPALEEKEVYPYRRVWRTASIEIVILVAVTLAIYLIEHFRPINLSPTQTTVIGLGLTVLPVLLWIGISYRRERRALLPRPALFPIMILGFLVANAVGIPLVNQVFNVNDWLTAASGLSRIVGFTLVVGFTQEFLKYALLRYSVWPSAFRIRSDGIAYAMAAGIGYAAAINLSFLLTMNTAVDPAALALRISEVTLSQVAISTIMGYLLAELKLSKPTPLFALPLGLTFAAFMTGIYMTARGGTIVGSLVGAAGGPANANSALQGLGVAIFFVIVLFVSLNTLITNADERARLRNRPEFSR